MDKQIIFMGATAIGEERKGARYMMEALRILSASLPAGTKEKVFVMIAGRSDNNALKDIPFPHKFIGFLNDDRLLALAYQSADILVCPSIEDAGPMMINEAIMCGTPVVAFEMGVALDLVHTGKTGYRAKLRDSEDLAKGIATMLDLSQDEYKVMSSNCRELGLRLCHPKVQVDSFEKLFGAVNTRTVS
jgi:glycosyltransferase involved in cell wall biosynthesis